MQRKFFCQGLVFCLLLFCVKTSAQQKPEILWDKFGVPHIFSNTPEEQYYAFGWAQMNNHANLILHVYGESRGRAAEYWGEQFIESDKQVLLFRLPDIAKKIVAAQSPDYLKCISAFVKGMNDYARLHTSTIDPENKIVLPVTVQDVFEHTLRVEFRFLTAFDRNRGASVGQAGSNAYAIAPSRSTSKNAILLCNPHLPWAKDFTMFFEAHLVTGELNAYGASLVGMPELFFGFNQHLGWAHTVNTLDATDRYALKLQAEGYLLDSAVVPFERKKILLKVNRNGKIVDQEIELLYSRHGPVIMENDGRAIAYRVAGLENLKALEEYQQMIRAKNLAEFESAIKMLQVPMFNVIYADDGGNIFYLFNGNIPKRPRGNFQYWRGIVDGTKSDLIWNETLGYDQLPKLLNPSTGFLQNANDPPWTCTYPTVLRPQDYLVYVAPRAMGFRPQRAVNMIKNDSSITYEELEKYSRNTEMETAHRFLPDLLKAVDKYPDSMSKEAAKILKSWDQTSDASSKGAILFTRWMEKIDTSIYAVRWNIQSPVSTPSGFKDEQRAVRLLSEAANEMMQKYGVLDISWRQIYRFQMGNQDYPASGAPQNFGVFRSFTYTDGKANTLAANGGETYLALIEFGKHVKASVCLCYGNATQKGNKHSYDQLQMLRDKKLRPALLTRNEVMKQLERREVLNTVH